ncbi:ribosomal large subunit pseudouridine synthase B domain protein [Vibrio parahaemolyticus EKP-021]|nr:ribosomal large subunit pseudouridine synthase B domain protein [Vibrio parahaemolyticus EKP-021]
MELDLKEVNYLRELVELRPEKETMLDLSKDNTSRKRERARSQKIRRAVKRHEERVSTSKGRSNNPARRKPKKNAGEQGARNKHR